MKIGRNDPCPCGSGKKYKRCCWLKEGTMHPEAVLSGVESSELPVGDRRRNAQPRDDGFPGMPEDVMSPAYWEEMQKHLPRKMYRELAPLTEQLKEYIEFESRRQEIEEAAIALESHRKKYEKLLRKPGKLFERVDSLLAEPPFENIRFSATDLQRAFEEVGYPIRSRTNSENFEIAAKVIRFLVDDEKRNALSIRLMLLLPEYVKAERFLDAWTIQHSAILIREQAEDGVDPFLLTMFIHAMLEWEEQRNREEITLFKKLDIDPEEIRRRGYNNLEARLRELQEDPEKKAIIEEFCASHPVHAAYTQAQCYDLESAALRLLERDDAHVLFLSVEELMPWFDVMEQRIKESSDILAAIEREDMLDDTVKESFGDLFFSLNIEIATGVFTASRLDRLASQFHEYMNDLAEDDHEGKACVHGALMSVYSQDPLEENCFLLTLCWKSFHAAMHAMTG